MEGLLKCFAILGPRGLGYFAVRSFAFSLTFRFHRLFLVLGSIAYLCPYVVFRFLFFARIGIHDFLPYPPIGTLILLESFVVIVILPTSVYRCFILSCTDFVTTSVVFVLCVGLCVVLRGVTLLDHGYIFFRLFIARIIIYPWIVIFFDCSSDMVAGVTIISSIFFSVGTRFVNLGSFAFLPHLGSFAFLPPLGHLYDLCRDLPE